MRVHVRDAETIDDLGDLHAPAPVGPGDLIASAQEIFRVEVVLPPPPGGWVVTALARRVEV